MDYTEMTKEFITFQKNTFNNAFNMMVRFQDQAEKVSDLMMEQAAWLPGETRACIDEWTLTLKESRSGYKRLADDAFAQMEALFVQA